MGNPSSYAAKLRDPRWQRKRLKLLERSDFSCEECGDETSELHIHHHYYIRGKEPWEYPDTLLTVLCRRCHGIAEVDRENLLSSFGTVRDHEHRELACLLVGFASDMSWFDTDFPGALADEEYRSAYLDFYRATRKFMEASEAYDAR